MHVLKNVKEWSPCFKKSIVDFIGHVCSATNFSFISSSSRVLLDMKANY